MKDRAVRLPHPVDLRLTLAPLSTDRSGPCVRIGDGGVWRAAQTPDGPGTQHLEVTGDSLQVRAWGRGAAWLLDTAPDVAGVRDDACDFRPPSGIVRQLFRSMRGLRLGATRSVMEVLVPTILEQKVAGVAARRSYRKIVSAYGEPAPGPNRGLFVPPAAARLVEIPYWEMHRLGVERRRAETIRLAALHASRLDEALAMSPREFRRRLTSLSGIGEWTAAIVARGAAGDSDAVETGDFNLPNTVTWALAGEVGGDDSRMLELLEPYRGHRGRVVRLLDAAGVRAPRRGPRLRIESFASR